MGHPVYIYTQVDYFGDIFLRVHIAVVYDA